MKRFLDIEESRVTKCAKVSQSGCDFLVKLPLEVVEIVIAKGKLSRRDIINISLVSSSHRLRFFQFVYDKVKLTWTDFKRFEETFKQKDLVQRIRVYSNLKDVKQTSYGEWNISLREILLKCTNLSEMTIEVMTSARCLKYQDNFDVDLSNKITSLKLISHAHEAADESLFELSQLQKFHNLTSLNLNGFFISKDQYFYPKYKPDLSDFKVRSKDGKLLKLERLELVNCRWEHPFNLSDIFSPTYPSPNPVLFSGGRQEEFTAPSSLSLFYSEESSSFVVSERFQALINNENDEQFLFQTRFYCKLKELKIVILNRDNKDDKYSYYYPWLAQLDLKRKFQAQSETTGEIENRSILTSLQSLTLVGWRLANSHELEKIFTVDKDMKYNMKRIQLYLIQAGDSKDQLDRIQNHLEVIFNGPGRNNNHCEVTVGYAEECLADHEYDTDFSKLHEGEM
ncbi:hypothetical protein FOA43_004749 [Brettanomyces nanus]|uniref:Uncharacterized protein n=1 Tax=Eeniella nana TaxID=13502 RepID=A0A875RQL1_EENNA|nr:uncharacterized protein FOA43_004749 [Brettanomyces nanus]QPG77340.1 hypothetical protein FOA43_004749 [Brettanomyces nanus]